MIKYGRSSATQCNVKLLNTLDKAAAGKKVTSSIAVDVRDYLICIYTIMNRLRPSNIINLRVEDIIKARSHEEYPGHRIISNSNYKTSTIYGEKYIIIPNDIYCQTMTYISNIRKVLSSNKSNRLFLPKGDTNSQMSQSNISTSLTSTFKKAGIFGAQEYARVSCTRIRCCCATFACNEGGIDTGFFAKHFMKNREETTDIFYNLRSNELHALSLAMMIGESFEVGGRKICIEKDDVEELTAAIQRQSLNLPTRAGVLQ